MVARIPDEQELRERITQHLSARPGAEEVAIAWSGYLAGLTEWGVMDHNAHARLVKLLPEGIGDEVIGEIMLGPDFREVQRQLSEEEDLRRGGSGTPPLPS